MLPVTERFVSINGEGIRAGCFSAFIRLRGCNLACSYCDTSWSCAADAPAEELAVEELVAWVLEQNVPCVTITGGEPLLHPEVPQLAAALVEAGLYVEVETNGSCEIDELLSAEADARECVPTGQQSGECVPTGEQSGGCTPTGDPCSLPRRDALSCVRSGGIHITADCKLPSSGMSEQMLPGLFEKLRPQDALKFVVGTQEDLDFAADIMGLFRLRCTVLFSPAWGQMEPATIVDYLREHGLTAARVQLQLHKIIWPSVEKGV